MLANEPSWQDSCWFSATFVLISMLTAWSAQTCPAATGEHDRYRSYRRICRDDEASRPTLPEIISRVVDSTPTMIMGTNP